MSEKLGDKLRKLRKEQGYTLEKLAELADISKSYLWELENRDSRKPSAEKLGALAAILGTTTEYFFEDEILDPNEEQKDAAFYRNFKNLEPQAKEQLRKILDAFSKD